MPTWSLSDTAKIAFKVGLYITFMVAFLAFTSWLISFLNNLYDVIQGAVGSLSSATQSEGTGSGLTGCILHALGIDAFLTSFISIFFSAASFWGVAIAYIHSFKFIKTGYSMLYKAVT